jgi:hypothetical protein
MSPSPFSFLQPVLSQLCDVICQTYAIDRSEAFSRAQGFIEENSERWRLDDSNLQYGDPFCRVAYLYMNVAVHARLVERALLMFPTFKDRLGQVVQEERELRVCALGGGPGSELLGITLYLDKILETGRQCHLDFLLVDRVNEWDESWHALKQGVDDYFRKKYGASKAKWPMLISRSFISLDLTNADLFSNFATRFNDIDIFVASYLVSEVMDRVKEFERVIEVLASRVKHGSLFLFVDRNQTAVREAVESLIVSNQHLGLVGLERGQGRLEDDPSELGEWFMNIPSLPRKRWQTFFALSVRR